MMVETVVDLTSTQTTAQNANALIPMEAEVEQIAHKQQHEALDGLEIIFVMTSTTMQTAIMMAETVVDVTLTQTTAQNVNALIPME